MTSNYARIGLIGAMKEEIEQYKQHMEHQKQESIARITYYSGTLQGKEIVLCQSGVGKVNAAVCTQILLMHYQVDCVVFTGVAGAVHPQLTIQDIVVSTDTMQHDMDATAIGFGLGEIPYAETSVYPSDPKLSQLAYDASVKHYGVDRVMRGRVLSGDQFIADRNKVKRLHEQFDALCTEMEGSAVGQTCHMNGVPYVVIRSMSDKADGSASVNYEEFTVAAADQSYQIVQDMLAEL